MKDGGLVVKLTERLKENESTKSFPRFLNNHIKNHLVIFCIARKSTKYWRSGFPTRVEAEL